MAAGLVCLTVPLMCPLDCAHSTLRRSAARRITAVIPYFGYKRDTSPFGEASTPGSPFVGDTVVSMSAADIAKMLETMVSRRWRHSPTASSWMGTLVMAVDGIAGRG